jgi:phage protein D
MADVVNLNQRRKAQKRADKAKTAADNRVKFGRTKAEKTKDAALRERHERDLNGKEITENSED